MLPHQQQLLLIELLFSGVALHAHYHAHDEQGPFYREARDTDEDLYAEDDQRHGVVGNFRTEKEEFLVETGRCSILD